MFKTHARILSEVPFDPFTPDNADVEEATMLCMEIVDCFQNNFCSSLSISLITAALE